MGIRKYGISKCLTIECTQLIKATEVERHPSRIRVILTLLRLSSTTSKAYFGSTAFGLCYK